MEEEGKKGCFILSISANEKKDPNGGILLVHPRPPHLGEKKTLAVTMKTLVHRKMKQVLSVSAKGGRKP